MTGSEAEIINRYFPPHPVLAQPTGAEMEEWSPEELVHLSTIWRQALASEKSNPLEKGHVPQNWRDAKRLMDEPGVDRLCVFGGNRSAKTTFSAWLVVNALLKNPGTRIICWSQNEKISNWQQQSAIYAMLPPEYRRKQRDRVAKVVYSVANGFTDNNFILSNGSHCIFMFYTQYTQDPSCIEGYELGWKGSWGDESEYLNLGNWFDEYLGDPGLMETMEARLTTRNAKNLTTFTPIFQFTEGVRYLLEGARTRENLIISEEDFPPIDYPGIAGTPVPYIQDGRRPSDRIIYFHTRENKFNDFVRFRRDLLGKSRPFILMKAFGVPSKVAATKFPKFQRSVNVIDPDAVPVKDVTRYMICDPAGDKPWFLVWVAVNAAGDHYVYREWPSLDQWGPWAEWRDGRWVAGEAVQGECAGGGYQTYFDLITAEEREGKEEVFERLIDPRMGSASMPGKEEKTSIIAQMADIGMVFVPAPGLSESEGIQALQALMDWDMAKEMTALNRPKFYVSESCGNVIAALAGYDPPPGKVDLKHPWKDPIDCLRYMAVAALDHVGDEAKSYRRSAGGY